MPANSSLSPQQLVAAAAAALEARKEEVNRLNVFPVPDGDTGTNMALTMDSVMAEVADAGTDATICDTCHAVTQGSLMGARGNSGVILSQILRGLCDVLGQAETIDSPTLADAMENAVAVAFQAVRKPVEGTMLTVIREAAEAVRASSDAGDSLDHVLERLAEASKESVLRTPDLLPVLKDAGVVDAGGFGLALLAEGLVAALEGVEVDDFDVTLQGGMAMAVEPVNDWDDDEYLYCTEFLLHGADLDQGGIEQWIAAAGGSELVVGSPETLKIHVHTDDPAEVLAKATSIGEVSDVHINNMRQQTAERRESLAGEPAPTQKALGIVAVSAGPGMSEILVSLGVDATVDGGQTMNPSTADIVAAADGVPAEAVIVLPNNKNIIMAAEQAVAVSARDVGVVPTKSVPEAFAAMLAFDAEATLKENVTAMTDAAGEVRVGEVTTAVKDSPGTGVGDIKAGQVIGITDGEIVVVGDDVGDVALQTLGLIADGAETLTVLAGADLTEDALTGLTARFAESHPSLEIDSLRGGQPLYPVILSVE